jgi:enoyl-CoA hydratase/carnithine racemase
VATDDPILAEEREQALWITLNRPAAMNAMTGAMLRRLEALAERADEQADIRCVVVTGAGRAFCAGADLKAVREEIGGGEDALMRFVGQATRTLNRIEALRKPVIAAVNGMAFAGGLELILCCDLVLAAESAKLGDAHANYGLFPGGGSSVRLPRKIGPTRAKYMLFTGEPMSAAAMMAAGLINEVVPDAELPAATSRLVAKLAAKSPLVLRRMKAAVDDGLDQAQATALRLEMLTWEAHGFSHDLQEGLAAFAERRPPKFTGR